MTNKDIAEIFRDLALISEFMGENPFKVNAYRNAYKVIIQLDEPVGEILARGEKIKGIGEIIKKKIDEIIRTGKLKKHEELVGSVPDDVLSILRQSELSPRIVRKLFDTIGVTNWQSLKNAYFSGKLTELGLGASSIKKIEKALKTKGLL